VVVDRGELDEIEAMLDESAPLQATDLGQVAAATSDPPADEVAALERPLRRFLRALRLL
jgi:HAMP domain-containing protein